MPRTAGAKNLTPEQKAQREKLKSLKKESSEFNPAPTAKEEPVASSENIVASTEQKQETPAAPEPPKAENKAPEPTQPVTPVQQPQPLQQEKVNTDLPSDLFDETIPSQVKNPLDGKVKEKAYAEIKTDGNTAIPKQGDKKDTPKTEGGFKETKSSSGGAASTPPLSDAEIKTQAEQTVDAFLDGYSEAHGIFRHFAKVSQKEITELQAEGVDMDMMVYVTAKNAVSVTELLTSYNESIDKNIVVSEKFKSSVRDPLIRIAIKRKILMSDEWFVVVAFGKDLLAKGGFVMALRTDLQAVLVWLKENVGTAKIAQKEPAQEVKQERREEPPKQESRHQEQKETPAAKETPKEESKKKSDGIQEAEVVASRPLNNNKEIGSKTELDEWMADAPPIP
jgi:hypothetical protein